MNIKRVIFFSILFYLSIAGSAFLSAEIDANDLVIFVDNEEQIPLERPLRVAYFKVLVDYNKMLYHGFEDTLRLIYGDDSNFYGSPARIATEGIKQAFYDQANVVANDSDDIIIKDDYSREELFEYSRMSERLTELFNELFEI